MKSGEARHDSGGIRFRSLYRKLERAIAHIEKIDDVSQMLGAILERLCLEFENELGFEGGRIYTREGESFVLRCGFGTSRDAPLGLRVPPDYPPHRRLLANGVVLMARDEPGVDERFEQAIGVRSTFAAVGVGEGTAHVIAFSLRGKPRREDVLFSLTLVRHFINLKLQQRRMAGMINAARVVQEGILPDAPPAFTGFEIASAYRAADLVSGDLFDYLPVSDRRLGIAIADSSGHGLPAALLARDVITALRTAAGPRVSAAAVVERVNSVIQRAALTGTFVSLFYAHLTDDGMLEYCNAGHEPPVLLGVNGLRRLDISGVVIGPFASARYESGSAVLDPGGLLALFTDGISERTNAYGELFGRDRIEQLVCGLRDRPAASVASALLAEADAFAGEEAPADDMTVVVVRRTSLEP